MTGTCQALNRPSLSWWGSETIDRGITMVFTSAQSNPLLLQLASYGGNKRLAVLHLNQQHLLLPHTRVTKYDLFLYIKIGVLQKLEYFTKQAHTRFRFSVIVDKLELTFNKCFGHLWAERQRDPDLLRCCFNQKSCCFYLAWRDHRF